MAKCESLRPADILECMNTTCPTTDSCWKKYGKQGGPLDTGPLVGPKKPDGIRGKRNDAGGGARHSSGRRMGD